MNIPIFCDFSARFQKHFIGISRTFSENDKMSRDCGKDCQKKLEKSLLLMPEISEINFSFHFFHFNPHLHVAAKPLPELLQALAALVNHLPAGAGRPGRARAVQARAGNNSLVSTPGRGFTGTYVCMCVCMYIYIYISRRCA